MITTPQLDDFNRDEDPLSQDGKWAQLAYRAWPLRSNDNVLGFPAAYSSQETAGEVPAGSYRTDIALPASGDCEVWGLVGKADAFQEPVALWLHLQDGTDATPDGYLASFGNRIAQDAIVWEFAGGAATVKFAGAGPFGDGNVAAPNDYLLFRRVGSDLEFWWYRDSAGDWNEICSFTDTTWTAGTIALESHSSNEDANWRGFGGGVAPVLSSAQIIRYR